MNLKTLTNSNLILVDLEVNSKEEVISQLVKRLYQEGKVSSEEKFIQAVLEREKQSPTGLEGGLAIPHGKSKIVKEAAFAVARLKNPIANWESIDENNKVELVFLLAIPEVEAGSTHLKVLSTLAENMANPQYREQLLKAKNGKELYENLDKKPEEKKRVKTNRLNKTIVAVTACPAGIAHTYMAAESLQRAANELGVTIYVEKQGANGIEDPHTSEQLKKADVAIFANDVAIKEDQRYQHLPIYRTTVATPLKDAKGVIENAIKLSEQEIKKEFVAKEENNENKGSLKGELKNSILTGISHIIPIIVAGGMILAFAVLVSQGFGLQELYNTEDSWLWMYRKLGGNMLGTLMVPILSGYMAYAIADKPALGPGLAAGVAANLINGGFLGGMLGGFLAGYIIKYLKKVIPSKGTFAGFISFWVYPVIGSLVVGTLMLLVFGRPVAVLNQALLDWLNNLSGANAILLGAVIGIMVSFDLGGPINKAAYTFCIGAMANGNYVPYATFASVKMVSAFSITAATLLFKRHFEEREIEVGKSTWLLGLAGITEGAIPFMIEDPLRVIPSLCIGSAITGAIVTSSNIGLSVPGAGIFSLFVLDGAPLIQGGAIWLGAALLGAAVSAALLVITRIYKLKKS